MEVAILGYSVRALLFIYKVKVEVKWSRFRTGVAQCVGRGIALLYHDRGTRRGWVVSSPPRPHFTPGKTQCTFYRRLGGPQGQSGWAENVVLTGIQSRTIHPLSVAILTELPGQETHTHTHIHIHPCRWTAVSGRGRWQSVQSVSSSLTVFGNSELTK
jgi:hypothetical protein